MAAIILPRPGSRFSANAALDAAIFSIVASTAEGPRPVARTDAMRTILLVKTSSLGDVVHNLPVVSDILRAFDSASIDWVVEKSFAAIPAMHPGVRQVIECELRVWRGAWSKRAARVAWRGFLARLSAQRYDNVIDTQGLLKSAIIARAANGRRAGLDWRSSREPLRFSTIVPSACRAASTP